MKRLLIGSCVAALLMSAAPVYAEGFRDGGHAPGIQNHLDRGKAMPPGHQKKDFLKAHYRRDHHHRDRRYKDKHKRKYHKRDYHRRDRDHYSRYDRRDHHRDRHRHSYREHHRGHKHDRRHHHREYHVHIGFDGHVSPEYRVARIIHNTRELIEPSHR